MKIALVGSLNFTYEIKEIADKLSELGFETEMPSTAKKILEGEASLDKIKKEKEEGTFSERTIKYDAIKAHYEIIKNSDAILVVNLDKHNVKNYIGGNSFLEIGFAHILDKKIYLLNDIPDMIYISELKTMQPIVINGD